MGDDEHNGEALDMIADDVFMLLEANAGTTQETVELLNIVEEKQEDWFKPCQDKNLVSCSVNGLKLKVICNCFGSKVHFFNAQFP